MFKLFVESIHEAFLICQEDFYTLPSTIQETILRAKREINKRARDTLKSKKSDSKPKPAKNVDNVADDKDNKEKPFSVDYDNLAQLYIDSVTHYRVINGRQMYVPLGAQELSALSRIYNTRLQTMTSQGVLKGMRAVTLEEIDPRAIERRDIHDFGSHFTNRIVRLINVKRNHYYVHLPRSADSLSLSQPPTLTLDAADKKFNNSIYWRDKDYSYINIDDLPQTI